MEIIYYFSKFSSSNHLKNNHNSFILFFFQDPLLEIQSSLFDSISTRCPALSELNLKHCIFNATKKPLSNLPLGLRRLSLQGSRFTELPHKSVRALYHTPMFEVGKRNKKLEEVQLDYF